MTKTPPTKPRPWQELKAIVDRDRHWTMRTLGEAAGMSAQNVSNLLTGKTRPTRWAIGQLADALKVPYSVLEPRLAPTRLAYTAVETAELLGVTIDEVLELVENGQLPATKTRLRVIISDAAIGKFLDNKAAHQDEPVEGAVA